MASLISDQHTIAEHRIQTSDNTHELYVQQWGTPDGTPILYVHGGPGGGCSQSDKRLFDASKHHVIFVDQRGSGLSVPAFSTDHNTTQLLIDDLEQIRALLSIEQWIIFGRSWGSTLALCFAIAHPKRVTQIVTGGIFLGTKAEDDWLLTGALATFFPETWDKHGNKPDSIMKYAHVALPSIKLDDRYEEINEEDFDESFFIIERYYADNNWFLPNNYIVDNAATLTMPVTIIQGRYDMMTPPMAAYALHKSLSNSTLQWTVAGHAKSDRGNFDATKAVFSQL